jgi:hypothetical protein
MHKKERRPLRQMEQIVSCRALRCNVNFRVHSFSLPPLLKLHRHISGFLPNNFYILGTGTIELAEQPNPLIGSASHRIFASFLDSTHNPDLSIL